MLITTRTYLVEELKMKLNAPLIKLRPFDEDEQVRLLVGIWRQAYSKVSETELEKKAQSLLQKVHQKLAENNEDNMFPLQLVMLAEAQSKYSGDEFELNMFSLFKIFVTGKLISGTKKVHWLCKITQTFSSVLLPSCKSMKMSPLNTFLLEKQML